jgi:hypothetical protein
MGIMRCMVAILGVDVYDDEEDRRMGGWDNECGGGVGVGSF